MTEAPHLRPGLSRGLEQLLAELPARRAGAADGAPDFDLLIVGSGYGAATALATLAGRQDAQGRSLRVGLLERGRERVAGSFPQGLSELMGDVRVGLSGGRSLGLGEGLLDLRLGQGVNVLLGNGLGGGSLINAGVMLPPHPAVLDDVRWPAPLRGQGAALVEEAQALARRLGAAPARPRTKTAVIQRLGQPAQARGTGRVGAVPITVAETAGPTPQGVLRQACTGCGDCATGCNEDAKISLDTTLLAEGAGQPGAELIHGATVQWVRPRPDGAGWTVGVAFTGEDLHKLAPQVVELQAGKVILAAGSLGSTEILMRSAHEQGLPLARAQLGRGFSTNGDSLAALYDLAQPAQALADEAADTRGRDIGPTIGAMVDLRRGDPATDMVIQDLAVPGALRRLFEESFLGAEALQRLVEADFFSIHRAGRPFDDDNAVAARRFAHTLPVALIGHDAADGRLGWSPPGGAAEQGPGRPLRDGMLSIDGASMPRDARVEAHHRQLEQLRARSGLGGRVRANPLWQLLPEALAPLLAPPAPQLVTVHPLGGCRMAEDAGQGVVNALGQVFSAEAGTAVHAGLVVMDGAIVPCALGINPALTIATLAQRAARALAGQWGWVTAKPAAPAPGTAPTPPRQRPLLPRPERSTTPTRLALTERMLAPVPWGGQRVWLRLTLVFQPAEARSLGSADTPARLRLDPQASLLEVFAERPDSLAHPLEGPPPPLRQARLRGELQLFGRGDSWVGSRLLRAASAYWCNRGRDLFRGDGVDRPLGERARRILRLLVLAVKNFSRIGAVRTLDYRLEIDEVLTPPEQAPAGLPGLRSGQRLRALKEVAYRPGSSVLRQIMQARLLAAPGLDDGQAPPLLEVDLPYFARVGVPLMRIHTQADQPTALGDVAALGMFLLRTGLHLHVWSLRRPDPPRPRTVDRLPGTVGGLEPELHWIDVARLDGRVVRARLARYRDPHSPPSSQPPVLLIHGYSASGTSFAHPALPEGGLAPFLARRGRDAWVLDLRTSPDLPTATHAWTFEDMAHADLPLAVAAVRRLSGQPQLDVVAHCMGAAMLSMALLDPGPAPGDDRPAAAAWRALQADRPIRRLVLSQVGPRLSVAPTNLLRAFLMRTLIPALPAEGYRFRVEDAGSPADDLLDRLLSQLPYPEAEGDWPGDFWKENPRRGRDPDWVRSRHRMDALYGETFLLRNMDDAVLDRLDDFFGPLNLQTVSQVIHFARHELVLGRGRRHGLDLQELRQRFPAQVLHLHGRENRMFDPRTSALMAASFREAGHPDFRTQVLAGFGHQDLLIGRRSPEVFRLIAEELARA